MMLVCLSRNVCDVDGLLLMCALRARQLSLLLFVRLVLFVCLARMCRVLFAYGSVVLVWCCGVLCCVALFSGVLLVLCDA